LTNGPSNEYTDGQPEQWHNRQAIFENMDQTDHTLVKLKAQITIQDTSHRTIILALKIKMIEKHRKNMK
jgi:hypothetical protein